MTIQDVDKMMTVLGNRNQRAEKKPDEHREKFLYLFKKTVLRVRDNDTNPIYLIRYSIFTCPLFSIKLHRILISDDDCMHDHPWSFISFILKGGYVEHTPFGKKLYGFGSILWRPAPTIHKLEIFQPATTLVITFKRVREWGFYLPSGWKVWYQYIRSGHKCE